MVEIWVGFRNGTASDVIRAQIDRAGRGDGRDGSIDLRASAAASLQRLDLLRVPDLPEGELRGARSRATATSASETGFEVPQPPADESRARTEARDRGRARVAPSGGEGADRLQHAPMGGRGGDLRGIVRRRHLDHVHAGQLDRAHDLADGAQQLARSACRPAPACRCRAPCPGSMTSMSTDR